MDVCEPWEKCLLRSSTHLYVRLNLFSIDLYQFFPCSRSNSLIRCIICKYFLPFCELSFHFLEVEKFKILIKSDVCILFCFVFCLAACVFGVISGKSLLNVRE